MAFKEEDTNTVPGAVPETTKAIVMTQEDKDHLISIAKPPDPKEQPFVITFSNKQGHLQLVIPNENIIALGVLVANIMKSNNIPFDLRISDGLKNLVTVVNHEEVPQDTKSTQITEIQ